MHLNIIIQIPRYRSISLTIFFRTVLNFKGAYTSGCYIYSNNSAIDTFSIPYHFSTRNKRVLIYTFLIFRTTAK
nr:MAG TPA: hypothetical protein [Caudoviricetes sp.]